MPEKKDPAEKDEFRVIDRRGGEKEKSAGQGPGFTMKEKPPEPPPSPMQIDISTLVLSLATGAMIHLGLTPDPATGQVTKNVELARQNIEILALLEEKTKGNLSKDEAQLLSSLLAEIRMRFVDASKKA